MCSHLLGVPTVDPLPHTVWNLQLCANSGFLSLLLSLNLNLGLRTLNFIPNLPSQTLIFAPSFSVACHSDSGLYILWIHGSYSKTRDVMVKSCRLWSKATQMLVLTPLLTAGWLRTATYSTFLSLSFLECKMKIIIVSTIQRCENWIE